MADQTRSNAGEPAPAAGAYAQQANPAFEAVIATRTATRDAAFLLPHLRPGMQLLDVGCGPGSITLGLAQAVAPGQVVGVDIQPGQVEQARALAAAQGVENVRFELGDSYGLPFPDHSFDAAFANGVLMHLREPLRALEELRRVLRPGGCAGVRDPDMGASLFVPLTPLLEQWRAAVRRVRERNGVDVSLSRHYRRLLLEAGFARAEAGASLSKAGTPEETRRSAIFLKAQLQGMARTVLAEGWMDQATLDAVVAEFDAWAQRPDAFYVTVWCDAVGWVSG